MSVNHLQKISADRIWRIREISDLRSQFNLDVCERYQDATSRAIVVLCYAHWEGYFAACVHTLVDWLENTSLKYSSLPEEFLLGGVMAAFDSLRDRKDNLSARLDFLRSIRGIETKSFTGFDRKIVLPRSNLNFEKLKFIAQILQLDLSPYLRHQLRLDKELVAWRHLIAHGEMFTLDRTKVESHTKFCEELLFLAKDSFEIALTAHGCQT